MRRLLTTDHKPLHTTKHGPEGQMYRICCPWLAPHSYPFARRIDKERSVCFLDFFRRSRTSPPASGSPAAASRVNIPVMSASEPTASAGFAVIDVETTGLS